MLAFVALQSLVPLPARTTSSPPPSPSVYLNRMPVTVFSTDLLNAPESLCLVVTFHAGVVESPLYADLKLLCNSLHGTLAGLEYEWLPASEFMSFEYSYKPLDAISALINALERHESSARADAAAANSGGTHNTGTPPCSPPDMCFYNTTSYAVLNSVKQILFGSDFPYLTHLVYDAVRRTAALERVLTDAHSRLLLLSSMVCDNFVAASRAHTHQAKASCSWFSGCRPKTYDSSLANIAIEYDRLLPLIDTATTLIGSSPSSTKNSTASSGPSSGWRHGTSLGEGDITCTFWYLPPIRDIITTFEKLLSWY
ncbi:hypothetical protein LY76DRAFT_673501 [Colletotrichum caudatum]|nr:hypothetical protein LY76DRAFT_673501 [Colletotrichum caudatum]